MRIFQIIIIAGILIGFGLCGCKKTPEINLSKIAGVHTLAGVDSSGNVLSDSTNPILLNVTIYLINDTTIVTSLNGNPGNTMYQSDTLRLVFTDFATNTMIFSYSYDPMDFEVSDNLRYNYVTNKISQTQIVSANGGMNKLELATP